MDARAPTGIFPKPTSSELWRACLSQGSKRVAAAARLHSERVAYLVMDARVPTGMSPKPNSSERWNSVSQASAMRSPRQ